jgi:hypothetical protein
MCLEPAPLERSEVRGAHCGAAQDVEPETSIREIAVELEEPVVNPPGPVHSSRASQLGGANEKIVQHQEVVGGRRSRQVQR